MFRHFMPVPAGDKDVSWIFPQWELYDSGAENYRRRFRWGAELRTSFDGQCAEVEPEFRVE